MVTVHEFLSRLVTSAAARSAFETDPRGALEGAGLAQLSDTEVLQAASLVLDYAPVDAVEAYVRSLQPGLGALAGTNTHAAMNYLMPLSISGPDLMESDLATPEIFSQLGDVDEMLRGADASYSEQTRTSEDSNNSTDNSEQIVGSGNQTPVGSGNETQISGLVGDVNTGEVNAGNVAGNGVTEVVGGVSDTVGGLEGGDTMGRLGDVAGAGDVTGGVSDVAQSMTDTGEVTSALPVDTGAVSGQLDDVTGGITGADGPVGSIAGDVTGGDTAGEATGGDLAGDLAL